jgi:uncharacterized membrane protein YebE (DUF533 family)
MNPSSLLDALMQAGLASTTQNRIGHALGPQGLGGGGSPLGGILDGVLREAGSMLGAGRDKVVSGDPVALGGLGALAGMLFGGKSGALGGGALALLGSLAYSALKKASGDTAPVSADTLAQQAPLGVRSPANTAEAQAAESNAALLISAMVNAAKADGAIDGAEFSRLMEKVKEAGADSEAQSLLLAEMQKPLDLDSLIQRATTPELKVEVYAASLLAIEVDTPAERDYLQRLAQGLQLPQAVIDEVHRALGVNL